MKSVILAGGLGARISEETHLRPKPMIEIGGKPLLWHTIKMYSAHGVNDFVIGLGSGGQVTPSKTITLPGNLLRFANWRRIALGRL